MAHSRTSGTRIARYSFPSKIAALYIALSLVWVVVSDAAVASVFGGPPVAWRVELISGLVYVLMTGLVLYVIYAHRERVIEGARKMSEQRLRRLIESDLIGICFWERDGKVTDANDAFLEMLGYSRADLEAGNVRWDRNTVAPISNGPSHEKRIHSGSGKSANYERQVTRADGSNIWVIAGTAPLGSKGRHIGYVLDLSVTKRAQQERDELQDQLRQAHKLQAIGQLAGGVAHDFNNILSVMVGYTSLLESTLGESDERRHNTQQVLKAAGKASSLICKLLAFSRRQLLKPETLNLNDILEETGGILARLIGEEVELSIKPEPNLWSVTGDSTQCEQILINLVVNARDALPKGGKLEIRTANIELPEARARFFGIPAGPYVQLSVCDNGIGMSEETMNHIFEPFFTTKASGEGTGLGLAMVYGIVKQCGGHIDVKSSVGGGSTFSIYLPALQREQFPEQVFLTPDKTLAANQAPPPATILIAEDDEDVRALLSLILKSDGYHILEAQNGERALALASEYKGAIDLVLTDVRMPQKSGTELAKELREQRPGIRVIYMSGYVDNSLFQPEVLQNADGILEKPVVPLELLQRLRDILSSKR